MALFNIEFKRVEWYYLTETVEAESFEQARELALKLLESEGYQERMALSASYSDCENELNDVCEAHDTKWCAAYETLTADEVADYLQED